MQQHEQVMAAKAEAVDKFIEAYFAQMNLPLGPAVQELKNSMHYSATNGGKRFRPVLSLLVADLLKKEAQSVLPFAVAVEMIHTYSLIHDDLPCMDNDDFRRGSPTNHKVYGEDFALLAGDALLTEAFLIIAEAYSQRGSLAAQLTRLLSEAAGVRGMVGGQAIDLRAGQKVFSKEELTHLHSLKTGALIRVAVEGAALIADASPAEILALRNFGAGLGLAFQIADDILDHGEKDQDVRSFTGILGLEKTRALLQEISQEALKDLHQVSEAAPMLEYLIHYNQSRQV